MLDAALALVAERGATATTMDAIGHGAGVTKPVVYACYPSKRELMRALVRREEGRLAEHMRGSLPERLELGDVEALLRTGFRAFLTAVAAQPDSYRVIFLSELGADPSVHRRVERARRAQTERIAELAREGLRARDVEQAEGLAVVVASVVVGASEGAVELLLSDPAQWQPDVLGDQLARLMVRGLGGLGIT